MDEALACYAPRALGLPSQAPGLTRAGPPSLQVAMNILNSGRFSMGSTVAGMLKKLIGG